MIIRIKKRDLRGSLAFTLYLSLIILALSAISLPIVFPMTTNTTKLGFKVDLVISNRNPSINVSNLTGGGVSFSVDPISASIARVLISFNVTDADGASNINASTAIVNFTLGTPGSSQFYANVSAVANSEFGTCSNYSDGSTAVVINCTVDIPYFANESSNWVVNISVKDINGGTGINDTGKFTINSLSSLALPIPFVNFSNVNLGEQDKPSSPLILNNTGNDDFDQINISAAALVGTTTASESISPTVIFANITNRTIGLGVPLALGATTLREYEQSASNLLENATLIHGHTSAFAPNADKGNKTVHFFIDVPSSGLSSQLYNATFNVTVIDMP